MATKQQKKVKKGKIHKHKKLTATQMN